MPSDIKDEPVDADNPLAAIIASSFKLPDFYKHRPEVWFSYVESQFLLRGINDDEKKFAYVVSALPPEVAELITDTIVPPPASDRYPTIKARLLREFTLTAAERANVLLDLPGLGDQRPSQLLSKMLQLLPAHEQASPSIIFKQLFVRQLPPEIRAHIMDKYELEVRALAEEADRYFTLTGARIAAIRTEPSPAVSQPGSSSGRRRRSGAMCFYHARYGDRAHKCESPCSWKPGN